MKRAEHGNITKYKARLVALGCHQKLGVDYDEVYASVVSKIGLRIFLATVNQSARGCVRKGSTWAINRQPKSSLKIEQKPLRSKQAPRAYNQSQKLKI
eukprot:scaffold322_cov363-Pavlova_lutheri.AAC.7